MIGQIYIVIGVSFCVYRVALGMIDSRLILRDAEFAKKGRNRWLLLFDIPYPNSSFVSDKFLRDFQTLFFLVHVLNISFLLLLLFPVVIAVVRSFASSV